MKTLAVAEMMTPNPITCLIEDNIVKVSSLMKKYNISSVIVLHEDQVKGLITVTDIVTRVVAPNENPEITKAKQIMTTDMVSVKPTQPLEEVIDIMNSSSVSQVPVMENKKLLGFVTMKDIIRLEPTLFEFFTQRLERDEEDRKKFIQKYAHISDEDMD